MLTLQMSDNNNRSIPAQFCYFAKSTTGKSKDFREHYYSYYLLNVQFNKLQLTL